MMDRADRYKEIADRLYHVLKRELSDGHERFCDCEVCMVCMDYRAIRDVDTERVLPMSMAMEYGKPEIVVDSLLPPGVARLQGSVKSYVYIRNIGESERVKHEEIAASIERATEAALRTQNANLEAQILAVPEEQREHYHIRVQMHADGTRTQHFEHQDKKASPCTCDVCYRAHFTNLFGWSIGDTMSHLQKLTGTYYKDVSRLCLQAGSLEGA